MRDDEENEHHNPNINIDILFGCFGTYEFAVTGLFLRQREPSQESLDLVFFRRVSE